MDETQMVKTVDVHTHIISPELIRELERNGERYGVELTRQGQATVAHLAGGSRTKPIPEHLSRVETRLQAMDHQEVDVQVLSTWIDLTGYRMPVAQAAAFCRLQNDTIAEIVESSPRRYVGAATVPLQDPATAVEVLTETVERHGFRAVQIATMVGNRSLDDPLFEPFWDAAEALGVLVLIHPYDEQPPAALDAYYLSNVVGNPVQTTVALARLICGAVPQRHPRLRLNFAHGGGMLPYQIGRLQRAFQVRPEARARGLQEEPLAVLRSCYFDTVLNHPGAIRFLAELVGPEHLLMGSDYSFEMGDPTPVASVRAALPSEAASAVLGRTAARLLDLSG